jgi:hypothetical protein
VEALSRRVIYTIHDALNGVNTRPGADFLALPKSLSIPLIDSCLAGSYISLDGQPIYSQQPAQPDTVDIWGYLATRASLVGRHEEIFGTSDMLAVPDAFPWLNTSTLSSMVTPSMATCFLASLPAASNLVDIVSAIRGSSEAEPGLVSAGRRADIIWTCLMVRKFAAAFAEQHLQSAGRVVAAAAAGVGRAGASSRGGKPRTSGDGGSGRGGVLKAVGAGDESELPVLVLPVQKLAGSGSSCDRSRGWLRRLVGGAAGRVARLLRA